MTQKKRVVKSTTQAVKEVVAGVSGTYTLSTGKEVSIKVCNGKTLPALLELLSDISYDLGLKLSDAKRTAEIMLSKMDDIGFIMKLISKHSEAVYELVAQMTELTYEEVSELEIDDLCGLGIQVALVNKDFFIKRVLPLFQKAAALTKAK